MQTFDVAIVGAGPTGLACGIEVQKRSLSAILFDKGCIVNSIYHYPINLVFFTTPELLEIGDIPMTSLNEKPGRTEALKYYRRVADYYKLDVHQYERVLGFDGPDGNFSVRTETSWGERSCYSAKKIILASGYYDIPNRLNVPGEELDKVIHYYREAHPFYNHDVLIVGAKNSASIAALELHWTGARVTMVHRGSGISKNVKYWIKPNIENRIKSGEIKAYFQTVVQEIRPHDVVLQTPHGEVIVKNDFVFAMTGYRPDFEFMAEHGIHLDPATSKPITDPKTLESERNGVYLAGVIVAGTHTNEIFIENGRFHGKVIADAIAGSLNPSSDNN
ncbi:MAG: YpdA family putative bacillithiol disulfide reductase [Acidobacteriaceae bacterium]|nr:YpdA family putative bacillithiol disulfide reductase [Acidobacteriaceae bacterium]MBV9764729.1 YpdA family putative bacillithiol disulfide reductase [Acidobacteriaceae bacterium]